MSANDDTKFSDSVEAKREALARKLNTFIGLHRRCREAVCRRHQRCVGRTWACSELPAPPQLTPEQQSKKLADVRRMLTAEIERRKAAGEWDVSGSGVSAPKPYPDISARSRASYPCKASPDRPASRRRGARS